MKAQLQSPNSVSTSRFAKSLKRAVTLLVFVTASGFLFGQQRYHYRFELQGITDGAGAKVVTDFLRPVFNNPESPFAVFPDFNDELDLFDFFSDVAVTRGQLESAMIPQGVMVTSFNSIDTVEPPTEQR